MRGGYSPPQSTSPSPSPPVNLHSTQTSQNISLISNIFQCDGNTSIETTLTHFETQNPKLKTIISFDRPDYPSYENKPLKHLKRNLVTIKRSRKVVEASVLPVVLNINPRSLYNKKNEFCTLIEQTDAGICCVSESWDRSHVSGSRRISDILNIDDYKWVQNVVQRNKKGGKPAILLSEKLFHIKELSPDVITVPIGVEAVWALLIPKNTTTGSTIKHIAVASVYYSSTQTKKSDFLDHIAQSYNVLCAKYGSNLKFLICGDLNRLNIKPILNLSPDLHQVVQVPTRRNPDAILEKIITNLQLYFHPPETLEPLNNDEGNLGKPSDHLTVIMRPLSNENPMNPKMYRTISYRPFPDSAVREMGQWIQSESWKDIFKLENANSKAEKLEEMLMDKVNLFFPVKTIRINENDKPWINPQLIQLDRKRKKEYNKHQKSDKWREINSNFQEKSTEMKESYYKNMVQDLKISNPGQWYSKVKRMSSMDQTKEDKVMVQQFVGMSSKEQSEEIADQFASISKLYEPLESDGVEIPNMDENSPPLPLFESYQIYKKIKSMKKKASSVPDDVPWRIITEFSVELAAPLCNIYNTSILSGVWPRLWKYEFVTPVPKVFPPETTEDLRKISGTKNFSKIFEALISDPIIADMAPNMDKSQFGNVKGLSIQHYLVKFVNKILTILDSNNEQEKYAVLASLVDWSKAFDRQDPKLGIQSFIKNGVRPTLIPILISYFQDRKMVVKWHGTTSSSCDLPGGGPQGCTLGLQSQ